MKAIVIKQPFANFILSGLKTLETRTWATSYRGPLLIVAGKSLHEGSCYLDGVDVDTADLYQNWWRKEVPMPMGKAIAVVEVVGCRPMVKHHEQQACCRLYSRAVSWELSNMQAIEPFEMRGQMGLFEVENPEIIFKGPSFYDDTLEQTCRVCGCVNDDCSGCIERTGGPCSWVEHDLCSACELS